jgi:cytochrome c553
VKNIFLVASAAAGLCLMTVLGAAAESGVRPVARTEAESKVMSVCQNCHGLQGDSISPIFPRLNGQQPDYIVAQLKSLRIHKRKDTHAQYMGGIARELKDTMISGLAKYFAGQKPTRPQTGGALAAEGEKIFMNGVPAEGIAACQACHGKFGEGARSVPRIAGQHAAYFRMAMGAFRSTLREDQTMHGVTKNMTDREIEALASFLAND